MSGMTDNEFIAELAVNKRMICEYLVERGVDKGAMTVALERVLVLYKANRQAGTNRELSLAGALGVVHGEIEDGKLTATEKSLRQAETLSGEMVKFATEFEQHSRIVSSCMRLFGITDREKRLQVAERTVEIYVMLRMIGIADFPAAYGAAHTACAEFDWRENGGVYARAVKELSAKEREEAITEAIDQHGASANLIEKVREKITEKFKNRGELN